MKLLQLVRQFFIFLFTILICCSLYGQTKLAVKGVKINMVNAVYLGTNDLSVSSNGLVNVNKSTIKIAGTITSTGLIDGSNGTIELNGSAAQQLLAGAFAGKTIKALTINNNAGATVNDTLGITDVLTVSTGNLISQGFLTLKSSDSNTARVAQVTSAAAVPISGNVIVERFITAKRAFRFLTAPVNATTTIRDNWMEGVFNPNTTSGNVNPIPNFGTHITGPGGHLNRFDETITNNPSLFTYDSRTQKWVAASNTDTILKVGQAFSIMVRGSRSTNLNSNNATPSYTTLRAKGALVTGTISLTAAGAGGTSGMPELSTTTGAYNFLANPYASPVDWLLLDTKDISNTIYIFDPTISGSSGRGGYVAFNRTYPSGVSSNDTSKIDNNIQSGQAFFIQTTGPNPSVSFKENYKSSLNRKVFRAPNRLSKISLQLLLPDQQTIGGAADGLSVYFSDNFSEDIGNEDSYKFPNQDENIAILRNGKLLSIEGRKLLTANDTLHLKVWHLTSKDYILKIALTNFPDILEAYLEDTYLHTSTKLNRETANVIAFAITSDTLSVTPERFKIVFKKAVTVLAQPIGIDAYVKSKGVELLWTRRSETNVDSFLIEKSINAHLFGILSAVKVKPNVFQYNYVDENPTIGDNYYRITFLNNFKEAKVSRIVKVKVKSMTSTISAVANEIGSNSLTLSMKNIERGDYSLSLINNVGQKVYSNSIVHHGGSAKYLIAPKNLLTTGIYYLQVSGENTEKNIAVLVE